MRSIGAALLFAAQPATAAAASPDWQAVLAEVETIAEAEQLPGFGVVVFDEGKVAAMRSSWQPDTPFRWGSITKTVTALAALQLEETRRLDLDAPVKTLLPPGTFNNPWSAQTPLTTRHLLELSAGLPDLSSAEWDNNQPRPLFETLGGRQRTLLWPPGLQHSYSNVPPGLTAGVIETVTGQAFARHLRDAVLIPLGMNQAGVSPVPDLPGGFKADGVTELPYWHMTFTAFGALNASLVEMSRLLEMLLHQGRLDGMQVFSPASIMAMFEPGTSLGARNGLEVGYGAGMYSWIRSGHQFWGHGGDADGYLSRYGLLPKSGRAYLLSINTDRPELLRRLRRLLEDSLATDLAPQLPPASAGLTDLAQYTGSYYPSSARFNVDGWRSGQARRAIVTEVEAGLEFKRGNRTTVLLPAGPGQFRRAGDPVITVVFITDPQGSVFIQGELGNYVNASRCPGFIPTCHQ